MKLQSQICSGPNQYSSGNFFYNVLPSDCKKGKSMQRGTQGTKHTVRRAMKVLLKQQVGKTRQRRESAVSRVNGSRQRSMATDLDGRDSANQGENWDPRSRAEMMEHKAQQTGEVGGREGGGRSLAGWRVMSGLSSHIPTLAGRMAEAGEMVWPRYWGCLQRWEWVLSGQSQHDHLRKMVQGDKRWHFNIFLHQDKWGRGREMRPPQRRKELSFT